MRRWVDFLYWYRIPIIFFCFIVANVIIFNFPSDNCPVISNVLGVCLLLIGIFTTIISAISLEYYSDKKRVFSEKEIDMIREKVNKQILFCKNVYGDTYASLCYLICEDELMTVVKEYRSHRSSTFNIASVISAGFTLFINLLLKDATTRKVLLDYLMIMLLCFGSVFIAIAVWMFSKPNLPTYKTAESLILQRQKERR